MSPSRCCGSGSSIEQFEQSLYAPPHPSRERRAGPGEEEEDNGQLELYNPCEVESVFEEDRSEVV
jgi:hypothetical protein